MTVAPTVVCPECAGKAVVTAPCRCRDGDGGFLVDAATLGCAERSNQRPWPGCEVCRGTGSVTAGCCECEQQGRLRAQVVLTVGNLDTGQVASANLVAGAVEPQRTPAGRWKLPLGALIVDLAGQAGIAPVNLREPDIPEREFDPVLYDIHLPRDWQPDLPTDRRHALESQVIARGTGRAWIVLLGHGPAAPPPDHTRLLARLCALADQLRVDLIIDARPNGRNTGLSWQLSFAHPGGPVPASTTHRSADDLLAAIAITTVEQAATGLDAPSPDIVAHYLNPYFSPGIRPATGIGDADQPNFTPDVDQLERRVIRDAEGNPGAQAIWRDRRWWHTTLRAGDPGENLMELETGQVIRRDRPALRLAWDPPASRHHADPIPATRCRRCAGNGVGPHRMPCERCKGNGRIQHGVVLTITDLRGRYLHINWRPDDDAASAALVVTYPSGVPTLQLPEHYRVGRWSTTFDVRPEDLTSLDGENVIGQDLRDGIVHLIDPAADPVRTYLTGAATGRPAGRIIVRANDWPGPSLAELARLALGLNLGIEITVVDHRLNVRNPYLVQGMRWSVELVDPATPIGRTEPHQRSVAEAVAYCLRYLGGALRATVPSCPDQPVPIPQQPAPLTSGALADLLALPDAPRLTGPVRRLAVNHPGWPATARLDTTGYRIEVDGRPA